MGSSEQEALARKLCAIWGESFGNHKPDETWEKELSDNQRTAWIMVAQFVEAQIPPKYGTPEFDDLIVSIQDSINDPMATDDNEVVRIVPVSKGVLINSWVNGKRVYSVFDEPDHK
jgi:hypothetical protein